MRRLRPAAALALGGLLASGLPAGVLGAGKAQRVVVSSRGFDPAVLRARKGEALRLELRSADGEHCFAIDELRVEKRVRAGQDTEVVLVAGEPGTFRFYCCLETGPAAATESGRLVVSD